MLQKTDYLEIKDKLFKDKNFHKIYNEICEWKCRKFEEKYGMNFLLFKEKAEKTDNGIFLEWDY